MIQNINSRYREPWGWAQLRGCRRSRSCRWGWSRHFRIVPDYCLLAHLQWIGFQRKSFGSTNINPRLHYFTASLIIKYAHFIDDILLLKIITSLVIDLHRSVGKLRLTVDWTAWTPYGWISSTCANIKNNITEDHDWENVCLKNPPSNHRSRGAGDKKDID